MNAFATGAFDVETEDNEWQVIPSKWIKEAQARWVNAPPEGVKMTAVASDIAQGGKDRFVVQARHDFWYGRFIVLKGSEVENGPDAASEIVKVMRDRCRIVVDAGGGYGGDTLTQLSQADITCYGFIGANKSRSTSRDGMMVFNNLRTQSVWQFREALDPAYGSNIALPPDPELFAELCAYRYEAKKSRDGKLEANLLPKADMKEALGRSPDKAGHNDYVTCVSLLWPKDTQDIGRPAARCGAADQGHHRQPAHEEAVH